MDSIAKLQDVSINVDVSIKSFFNNEMPIVQPVPIKTKGFSWCKKAFIWIQSRRRWILVSDFYYTTKDGVKIFIPKGFIFDGASIPRIFWWFLSPTGLLFIPSIIHDYIYKNGFYVDCKDNDVIKVQCTRKIADKMFYDISLEVNELHFADVPAYLAVRIGGWYSWNKNRKI